METQLTQEEQNILNILTKLLKDKHIKIGVNITPKYGGYGGWNTTNTFAIIGDEWIPLEVGDVEIIASDY